MTVPTMIAKYQKEQTVTRLKKAYSTLAQTTAKAIADNGPIETWEVGDKYSGQAAHDFFLKYIKPYLNVSNDCNIQTTGTCEFKYSYLNSNTNNIYSASGTLNSSYSRFYIQDGTLISLFIHDNSGKYIELSIDINGKKKPNTYGKDIFRFNYFIQRENYPYNGKFLPAGYTENYINLMSYNYDGYCNKNAVSRAGLNCANVIVASGWTIPDSYPW